MGRQLHLRFPSPCLVLKTSPQRDGGNHTGENGSRNANDNAITAKMTQNITRDISPSENNPAEVDIFGGMTHPLQISLVANHRPTSAGAIADLGLPSSAFLSRYLTQTGWPPVAGGTATSRSQNSETEFHE